MKLRTQIITLGLAGAAAAFAAGAVGLLTSSRLGEVIEGSIHAGHALQASQEADMMHDAVRGDAQLALLGALQKSDARLAEAEKGLKEHAATFEGALDKLAATNLSAESREALGVTRPLVKKYIESAAATIAAARKDPEAAEAATVTLQGYFLQLEKQMAALSETVEKTGDALNVQTQSRLSQARTAMAVTLAFATAAMVLAAIWLARRMTLPMEAAVAAADRLAHGDLTARITPQGNDETQRLLRALATMQENVSGIVRHVKSNADEVATASSQIAHGNQDLSQRTEEQAGSLQQTASTMEELSATLRQNADSAQQANTLVQGASEVAQRGGQMMGQVVDTMKLINDSSRQIADIIGVIDGIAFQTNILALNAAVEAARAGEQGRGFAVVASEVRSLAQRSADAARQIKTLISSSVERVEQGSHLVDDAGQTMQEIVDAIGRVTGIVAEISDATVAQSAGVNEVGGTVARMDQATQQNAALVEQSAAAAESLRQQAEELVRAVGAFRLTAA